VIIFGSIRFLSKKSNQTKKIFKKNKPKPNQNRVKPTGFSSVLFFYGKNQLVQTSLARFFRFWLGFLGFFRFWLSFFQFGSVLARFFSVLLGFGSVFFPVSVRFFWFFAYKTEIEPVDVFKILIGFFFGSVFFPVFSV
jgi:hypothetical protein